MGSRVCRRVDRDAGSHGCAVVDPASFEGNGVVLRGLVLAQGVLLRTLSGHRKVEGWGMLCPPLNLLAWMPQWAHRLTRCAFTWHHRSHAVELLRSLLAGLS